MRSLRPLITVSFFNCKHFSYLNCYSSIALTNKHEKKIKAKPWVTRLFYLFINYYYTKELISTYAKFSEKPTFLSTGSVSKKC